MTHLASLFRKLPGNRWIARSVDATEMEDIVSSDDMRPEVLDPEKTATPSPFRKIETAESAPADQMPTVALEAENSALTEQKSRLKNKPVQCKTSNNALNNLSIPCPDPTREERLRDNHQNRALRLVRQEDWDKLITLIKTADRDRTMTPGGMCVAELMAFGARADVVLAIEHALLDRVPEKDAPMISGIEALEYVLEDHSDNYVIGCIVAQAHIDIAWSWRGIGWDVEIAPRNREAFEAHFARARDIVDSFDGAPVDSALLASTACALLGGENYNTEAVADRYEALIDLNSKNVAPFRALGTHMLPRWYGSFAALELEARRTAVRTRDEWGAGGYTWVMFDAISVDDEACARLDLQFFIEGLRDIIRHRPDPHTVNLLAAYCANTMGQAHSGNDAADYTRAQIAACADWIVREHLTELHPMIWAHAAQGFINNLRVSSASRFAAAGQDDALRIIAALFKREIADGKRIVFTDEGPVTTAT